MPLYISSRPRKLLASQLRATLPVVGISSSCARSSLHYFAWEQTVSIVDSVRLALRLGGPLVCRLNSTEETKFGASGCEEIEPNYFLVNGQPKRFLDEIAVRRLFADGGNMIALERITTDKYQKPKAAWEVILERDLARLKPQQTAPTKATPAAALRHPT